MIYGSVCSGIEAATVAWHSMGWRPAFFSEIDSQPRAVLRHHYPDVPLHGDFTTIKDGEYDAIELLVGGTPCQDFSVAGLRKGIAGDRGNLTLEFLLLAKRLRPRWLVWENVPGVLSSVSHIAPDQSPPPDDMAEGSEWVAEDSYDADESHAFACFLAGLSELGYGYAYRTLDAQYYGLAQRRERVFVVGYLGDWRPPAAVLFDAESMRRNPPPSREKGQDIAPCLDGRSGRSGCNEFATSGGLAHTLRGEGFDASEDGTGRGTPLVPAISPALKARDHKGPSSDGDNDGAPLIPMAVPILEAGARTGKSTTDARAGSGIGENGDPMYTLQAGKQHAVAFAQNQRDELREMNVAGALASQPGMKQQTFIAFDCKGTEVAQGHNGITPTMRAQSFDKSHANGGGQLAVAYDTRGGLAPKGSMKGDTISPTLRSKHSEPPMTGANAVRRLTPRECERLQGFPDDYTLVPFGKRMTADGPRYRMLGNSMAVPVMRKIGERIEMVEKLLKEQK